MRALFARDFSLYSLIRQNMAARSGLRGMFSWAVDSLLCIAGGRRHHDDVAVAVAPRRPLSLFVSPSILPPVHGAPEDTTAKVVVLGIVTKMYRFVSGRRCHHPNQEE
jgi:hypothetical protein